MQKQLIRQRMLFIYCCCCCFSEDS